MADATARPGGVARPRPDGTRLDYQAALKKASKGATAANIAKAAGSKATSRKSLARQGAKILARLRAKGEIFETFQRLGFHVEEFARDVIQDMRLPTQRVTEHYAADENGMVQLKDRVVTTDYSQRLRARQQYMEAIGVRETPLESEGGGDPAGLVSDEQLVRLLEKLEREEK